MITYLALPSPPIPVLISREDRQGNVYTLLERLTLLLPSGSLTVPAGFRSDGASVPRFFWRLVFPPGDTKAMRAAFLHDYLYRVQPEGWTKKDADDLFYEVLRADGMRWISAYSAYIGVRFFGFFSWKKAQKQKEKNQERFTQNDRKNC